MKEVRYFYVPDAAKQVELPAEEYAPLLTDAQTADGAISL